MQLRVLFGALALPNAAAFGLRLQPAAPTPALRLHRPPVLLAVPDAIGPSISLIADAQSYAALPSTTMLISESYAALPSALAAYGHYLGLILTTLCLATERLTIKPGMSEEDEELLVKADAAYGLVGLLVAYTGYLRVAFYGKGWEFYQHEPIFWLKMTLAAVVAASSFFPTITVIKRAVAKREEGATVAPMSEKLAARMTSVVNAEILALLTIPLAATTMARGIGYAPWLPWQAGAAPAALALGGLGYKYVKEALDWEEDE